MKTKLVAVMILAAGSAFAETHFSVGIGVGVPGYYAPAPYARPYAVVRPPFPGPGYVWIDGYNDAYGRFIPGYWDLPPYADSFWIAPRFYGGRYLAGYWGRRGFGGYGFERRWDRDDFRFRGRDFDRDDRFRGRDRERGFRR